jgi:hypothetical protein
MDDLRGELSAAFDDLAPVAEADTDTPQETQPEGRARGEGGKFAKAEPETPEAEAETDEADKPETKAEEPALPAIPAPQSLSAAEKAAWDTLPRAAQEIIQRREGDVSREFQRRAETAKAYEPIASVLESYKAKFAMSGVAPAVAVQQLLAAQDMLEQRPYEAMQHLARAYGVDLSRFASTGQQQPALDPATAHLMQEVGQLKAQLTARERSEADRMTQETEQSITSFASDPANPHFDAVRVHMGALMAQGLAADLKDAYDQAVMANPTTRAQVLKAQRDEWEQAERQRRSAEATAARTRARSISGAAPSASMQVAPDSIRGMIEAAYGGRL